MLSPPKKYDDAKQQHRYRWGEAGKHFNIALDTPYLSLHVFLALLDLGISGGVYIYYHRFEPAGLDLLKISYHDLLGLFIEIGSTSHLADPFVESLLSFSQSP